MKLESNVNKYLMVAGVAVGLIAAAFSYRAYDIVGASDRKIEAMRRAAPAQLAATEEALARADRTWIALKRLDEKVNILSTRVSKAFGEKK